MNAEKNRIRKENSEPNCRERRLWRSAFARHRGMPQRALPTELKVLLQNVTSICAEPDKNVFRTPLRKKAKTVM